MKQIGIMALVWMTCVGQLHAQSPYYMQPEFRNANKNWIYGRTYVSQSGPGAPPRIDSAQHLNFSTNPPTVSRKYFWVPLSRPGTRQATVAVSDRESGNLLFYTEGIHVFNRKQEIMPNGSGLFGDDHIMDGMYYRLGMHQGFCVVPDFKDKNRYYLFNLTHAGTNTTPARSKLYYNVVDMSLDGGYGDVFKNIPLDTAQQTMFGEPIIAIPGEQCDVWVLLYDRSIMSYKAFHVTDQGISHTPVVSPSISGLSIGDMLQGRLAVSPDRTKIAMAYNYNGAIIGYSNRGGLVAKFDPETGVVSDEIVFEKFEGGSSAAFSPDNNLLYFSSRAPTGKLRLWQYDVSTFNVGDIVQSKSLVDSFSGVYDDIRRHDDILITAGIGDRLGCILQPNRKGVACDFRKNYFATAGIVTNDTMINTMSLGNDVIFPLPPTTYRQMVLDTFICRVDPQAGVVVIANPTGLGYIWDNGASNAQRTVTRAGTYWVQYTRGCHTYVDSFKIRETSFLPPVINVEGNRLYTSQDYELYQWFRNDTLIGNANKYEFFAEHNALYHVVVQHKDGCTERSQTFEINNLAVPQTEQFNLRVYPNPVKDMLYIESSIPVIWKLSSIEGRKIGEGSGALSVQQLSAGIYFLELREAKTNKRIDLRKIVVE